MKTARVLKSRAVGHFRADFRSPDTTWEPDPGLVALSRRTQDE
jgi:hypothetical protein